MRLHDYLRRIDAPAGLAADAEGLRRLHVAHREAILFENLSIQAGGSISVALEDVERKFLDERRGGYCFEHNTIFRAALLDCGFSAATCLGHVRRGPPERWCRTHMVVRVTASDGSRWLADVGFGAIGLIEPIPLADGVSSVQRGLAYMLRREGGSWVLSMRDEHGTQDLYDFSEEPQTLGDLVVANHYTSTHPDSIFRRTLTIQGIRGNERRTIRSWTLSRYVDGRYEEQPLDRASLERTARELFGVDLPAGPLLFESNAESQEPA
ncbi:MAG TPA: arylamine N-acetyltransferase [Vicinamibacterales bacterium]|jgi:N-hydroxyarylamine O-acetyltransferase